MFLWPEWSVACPMSSNFYQFGHFCDILDVSNLNVRCDELRFRTSRILTLVNDGDDSASFTIVIIKTERSERVRKVISAHNASKGIG